MTITKGKEHVAVIVIRPTSDDAPSVVRFEMQRLLLVSLAICITCLTCAESVAVATTGNYKHVSHVSNYVYRTAMSETFSLWY